MPTSQPLEPVPVIMQQAARKGMQYVLLSMTKHAKSAEAQKLGCWQLATTATKQRGIKRAGLAKECATVVLGAMQARRCALFFFCHTPAVQR